MNRPLSVDRSWFTLSGYGALLLAFGLPAWLAFAIVVQIYLGNDDEFGHNMWLLLLWAPACLLVAIPTSIAFVRLVRRRCAFLQTIIGWSGLATAATALYLLNVGLLNFESPDYQYMLESTSVRVIGALFALAALVLALAVRDALVQSSGPGLDIRRGPE